MSMFYPSKNRQKENENLQNFKKSTCINRIIIIYLHQYSKYDMSELNQLLWPTSSQKKPLDQYMPYECYCLAGMNITKI